MRPEIKSGAFSGLVPNEHLTMPDGARWRQFEIAGGVIVLTSSGNELFQGPNAKDIITSIRNYIEDITRRKQNGDTRQYLANGGNGEVYTIAGHSLVVKESRSKHSLYSALQRMDTLSRVIETHLPHWVSVAPHYGLITSRELDREYMLIEKIDNGISLEDLVQFIRRGSARSQSLTDAIELNFPGFSETDLALLEAQIQELKTRLKSYAESDEAKEHNHTYDNLLPDPNYANILVEKLKTPLGGKHYKFWIIDQ